MTSPIDPIRRTGQARRATDRVDPITRIEPTGDRNLPVPLESPPDPAPPPLGARTPAATAIAAQLLGQSGQKRGLRGGPATLDAAKTTYTRTEWSGRADRRTRGGTKTEI